MDGVELGRKMFNNELTDVAALLAKRNDSEVVKEIKKLITDMLAHDPDKRPRIGEVVDCLSQLRTSLGVQVLVAVDTVWQPSICYRKSDILFKCLYFNSILQPTLNYNYCTSYLMVVYVVDDPSFTIIRQPSLLGQLNILDSLKSYVSPKSYMNICCRAYSKDWSNLLEVITIVITEYATIHQNDVLSKHFNTSVL